MDPPDITQQITLTELQIKEAELRIKLIEEKKASRFSFTVATPLLAAVLGVITSVLTAQCQRQTEMDLHAKRYRSTLLLKALASKDQDAAAKMLTFMVNTQLLDDTDGAIMGATATNNSYLSYWTRLLGLEKNQQPSSYRLTLPSRTSLSLEAVWVNFARWIPPLF